MTHQELVDLIKPGKSIKIKGDTYLVKQHIVWMQHRAGYSYDKWVLVDDKDYDGYRFFIEVKTPAMGFAKIFTHNFIEPMPEVLEYQGKKYKMVWGEFCTAIKVEGEEVYKQGDAEIWWDYVSEEDETRGLSLVRSWETWEREDLSTQSLELDDVVILNKQNISLS